MREASRDVDLAEGPLGSQRNGEVGMQDLERRRAVQLDVLGQVDRGRAPWPSSRSIA